jgi:hypothetical protein
LGDALIFEADLMLRPDSCVVDFTFEVRKATERRCESSGREADARDEPFAIDLTPIRRFDKPLMSLFIECCTIHVLVVGDVLLQVPFLFDVREVSSQLLPACVSFFEGEAFPKLFVEELIDGCVAVNAGSWVAIPIPNSTARRTMTG